MNTTGRAMDQKKRRMVKRIWGWGREVLGCALALLLLVAFPACETPESDLALDQSAPTGPVALSAGDVIRVSIPGYPELTTLQTIQPDGKLNLPSVGEIRAAGKSIDELQRELAKRYASTIRDANVILTLESTASVIYVTGAVNKQGKIALTRPMTVFEAIMEAGGYAPGADAGRVRVIRREGDEHRTMIVDLRRALSQGTMSAAYVKPYDVIVVSEGIF